MSYAEITNYKLQITKCRKKSHLVSRVSYLVFALAMMVGCVKITSDVITCEVVITPKRSEAPSNPYGTNDNFFVRVYAYYIPEKEIANWRPSSYADASAGIITNKRSGERRTQNLTEEQGADNLVRVKITSSPVLLVAVDPFDKMYAWREFEYEIPMPRVYIPVKFFLAKEPIAGITEYTYMDSAWKVVNSKYE